MRRQRPLLVETLLLIGLIAVPFILPHLGFPLTTINRILIWALVGIGFDLLFGYTGLLSFGQAAFFGTGGMFAAYLLTETSFDNTIGALFVGTVAAGIVGYLVGLIALRRTGIYFAMITVAIAEVFFFLEFNPLSEYTGGENGIPGVPPPAIDLGFFAYEFSSNLEMYVFFAFCYFVGMVVALRIVRSPVGLLLRGIRDNPQRARALGHDIHGYKLAVFVVAAMYAGLSGGLLAMMQGFMPPDAFMFHTSGEIVIQTAIGGAGTLFGPLLGAATWLLLSDFLQTTLGLGATWKLILGIVFVILVVFFRRGLVGAVVDLYHLATKRRGETGGDPGPAAAGPASPSPVGGATIRPQARSSGRKQGPILEAIGLTRHYGGVVANSDIDFVVEHGEVRGIIGPNGAGKSTLLRAILGLVPLAAGSISVLGLPPDAARRSVAYVPQAESLDPEFPVSVGQVVLMGRYRDVGWVRRPGRADRAIAAAALDRVGLSDRAGDRFGTLSGGQQQRVLIARAVAQQSRLLLLDEPFNGVDAVTQDLLLQVLGELRADGVTVVISTHDLTVAHLACGEACLLNRHQVAFGPVADTLTPALLQQTYGARSLALAGDSVVVAPS